MLDLIVTTGGIVYGVVLVAAVFFRNGLTEALRIDALLGSLKGQSGEPQAVDLVLLARGQVALDPDETAGRGQAGGELFAIEIGQDRNDLGGGFVQVEDFARVGVKRHHRQAGGEQNAVAVDDVGPRGDGVRRR